MDGNPAPEAARDLRRFSIVCLSSQRWASALPTNRQQIMVRAARRGHPVLFVETADFFVKRIVKRRRVAPPESPHPNIRIVQLHNLVPFAQRYAVSNTINFRLGGGTARRAAAALRPPRVLWIYDPRGAAAIGTFGEDLVAYDCVDDYGEQMGYSRHAKRLISRLDREVAARADLVFTTTESLRERHARDRGGVHLVPNVGDFEHFSRAADRSAADPELAALPRPVLGFAGNLIETKVDIDLIDRLAAAFPGGTVLLVGPAQNGVVERLRALLERRPNVRWIGLRPYDALPAAIAAFDVALIPYASNEYTRSVFPLKVHEYLAAGKPVVAAGVPSVAGLRPHVRLADGPDEFVAAVAEAVAADDASKEARMKVASANTWDARTERLLSLVDEELLRAHTRRD
jgi:UDP-galactopyranose mutase